MRFLRMNIFNAMIPFCYLIFSKAMKKHLPQMASITIRLYFRLFSLLYLQHQLVPSARLWMPLVHRYLKFMKRGGRVSSSFQEAKKVSDLLTSSHFINSAYYSLRHLLKTPLHLLQQRLNENL